MRTKSDKEKQLYTQFFAAHDRLQLMRILYNETKDMRWLRGCQSARKRLEDACDMIELNEVFT